MFSRLSRRCFSTTSSPLSTAAAAAAPSASSGTGSGIGICALECYFPQRFVSQAKLEQHDKVSTGKYRVGLGQEEMAFVDASREDTASMAMNAVRQLLDKYGVSPAEIGRLEIGTETPLDKSKSIKSYIMQMFPAECTNMEGVDTINACYGGTAALLNALYWSDVQQRLHGHRNGSSSRKYALVVATDISVYDVPAARPTGGAGAVAMLVGPNAPLEVDLLHKASHHEHAYDFYKPDPNSPYPQVDGHLSNRLYAKALDSCYREWRQTFLERGEQPLDASLDLDYWCFHAPYNKLVQKSFARLIYQDIRNSPVSHVDRIFEQLEVSDPAARQQALVKAQQGDEHYDEKLMVDLSKHQYKNKVAPGTLLPKHLGNSYTASLYMGLCSLVSQAGAAMQHGKPSQRIGMFSYGSGLATTMFMIQAQQRTLDGRFNLEMMQRNLNVRQRLQQRVEVEPEDYSETLARNLELYHKADWKSSSDTSYIPTGAYHLESVDDKWRRHYARKAQPHAHKEHAKSHHQLQ